MYRGKEPPTVVWVMPSGVKRRIDFPHPKSGSRKETYREMTEIYENIDHEFLVGSPQWRFEAEYSFGNVDQSIIDSLFAIYNNTAVVKWIPHRDVPVITYDVVFKKAEALPLRGRVIQDTVEIKVVGIRPVYKKPTLDNMLGMFLPTRIAVINQ